MEKRHQLQSILEAVLGSRNVYFQPPETLKMAYPCIRYERDNERSVFANNEPYRHTKRYQVTVIDRDPDSAIPDRVVALPLCTFSRHYTADGLNHDVYSLYF